MAQKLISSAILIAVMCQLSQQKPTPGSISQSINETYVECNERMSSRCFGMPSGCVTKQNCVVLLSAKPTQSGADFVMFWNRDPTSQDRWVGGALSEDKKMGDDSVTECILTKNNTVTVRQGLTNCSGSCGVSTVEPVKGITAETGSFSDNVVSCSWSRDDDTMVKNLDFNILNKKYYILLAYGPMSNDDLDHHSDAWVSKEAVYLAQDISGNTNGTTKPAGPTPTPSSSNSTTSGPNTTVSGNTPTGNSTQTAPVSTNTPSNSTTPSSNGTSAQPTGGQSNTTPQPIQSTTPKGGATTITFNLSLAIFVTIILSLSL